MRVHFISIGGAVMHNMALALHQMGNQVSGSDDEIFEPALTRLKNKGLLPAEFGWHPEKINSDIDYCVLGMHARADNPELVRAKELGVKIYSFPEFVYENSKDKIRIVVGGSHGKTSTTAMIMHVLQQQNMAFDYLVGSQLEGFETMVKLSDAPVIVIEGDEYLTSALDPRPKFHWYKPHTAILTGIAWDHINVFPTFEIYLEQFRIFIDSIQPDGHLIYCAEDVELTKMAPRAQCNIQPYAVPDYIIENGITSILKDGKKYPLMVFGKHNLMNLNAAMMACKTLGISEETFLTVIEHFKGAAKRLEIIHDTPEIKVYRDFAHSPSKLQATVKAAIEQFDGFKKIGAFELHTFSSLNASFLSQYRNSMKGLDVAIVYYNAHVFELKKMEMLDAKLVENAFENVVVINDKPTLVEALKKAVSPKCVVLLMSSGNFDALAVNDFLA
jgi:UDP-N-acetylmuramate: L-alanyl-gamma-D-glutamyl-meso-diaminopimelate ligase